MREPPYSYKLPCNMQLIEILYLSGIRAATLLPCPYDQGGRLLALRPTLSDGLPFSGL